MCGAPEIPRVLGGMGINILTTPRGVMTGRQARKQGLGGEPSSVRSVMNRVLPNQQFALGSADDDSSRDRSWGVFDLAGAKGQTKRAES